MRALITGIDGFVGYYLTQHLKDLGYEVFGTTILEDYRNEDATVYSMNLLDANQVSDVINNIKPDHIYHLAGQSAVGLSWSQPTLTMSINVNGTIHLLDSVREHCSEAKVLIIGSSDQYGPIKAEDCPITEDQPLNPVSPYGISKVTQEQMAKLYIQSYGMNIIMARSFNHIGPRQSKNFVVADFASKIVEIERGAEPILKVGNLESYRDFTDVRDIVRAYHMLMKHGHIGEVYNVGSNYGMKIRDLLDQMVELSKAEIQVIVDPEKLRPVDVPLVQCDNSKIKAHTGWQIANNVHQTLKDTLNYWRSM